jgi:hypothetical protein
VRSVNKHLSSTVVNVHSFCDLIVVQRAGYPVAQVPVPSPLSRKKQNSDSAITKSTCHFGFLFQSMQRKIRKIPLLIPHKRASNEIYIYIYISAEIAEDGHTCIIDLQLAVYVVSIMLSFCHKMVMPRL